MKSRSVFNQDEDDLEDDFTSVLKKLGLEVPYDSAWDARGGSPVKTVEDLVHVLAWAACRRQPGVSASLGSPRPHLGHPSRSVADREQEHGALHRL